MTKPMQIRGKAAIAVPGVKKDITIEALLRWAYRDELPKAGGSSRLRVAGFGGAWGGVERYGELLSVIDDENLNRYGVVPDFGATTEPHPDAVMVGEMVKALDAFPLNLPDDWDPCGDWPELGAEGPAAVRRAIERETYIDPAGERRFKTAISRLIMRHALLGDAPVWDGEEPQVKLVCAANGKPKWFRRVLRLVEDGDPVNGIQPVYAEVEVDGLDPKLRIPYPDAYRKTYLDPDPAEVIVSRAEYEVWCAALDLLACDLDGMLESHTLIPSARPARPWETGELARPRVLMDLSRPEQSLVLVRGHWGIAKQA
jgi:hypothetical protein